jgi:hypothetical protein
MELYPPHWSYYFSLEDDLIQTGRYVEICEDNFDAFSIQYTRLILAAGSEVDVVAKMVCAQTDPAAKAKNINDYRLLLTTRLPAIPKIVIGIQWNALRLRPWESWGPPTPKSPEWWTAYNEIKHDRLINSKKGNLKNTIESIAGLYCLVLHLNEQKNHQRPARFLRIESAS